jgi:hypothetical protein
MGDRRTSSIHDGLTISDMLRIGIKAYACCSQCGCQKAVNLENLIELRGPDFSLFNRRNKPCKMLPGCEGYNYFSTDRWGGIITPFRDDETGHRWILEAIGERQARANPAAPQTKP